MKSDVSFPAQSLLIYYIYPFFYLLFLFYWEMKATDVFANADLQFLHLSSRTAVVHPAGDTQEKEMHWTQTPTTLVYSV